MLARATLAAAAVACALTRSPAAALTVVSITPDPAPIGTSERLTVQLTGVTEADLAGPRNSLRLTWPTSERGAQNHALDGWPPAGAAPADGNVACTLTRSTELRWPESGAIVISARAAYMISSELGWHTIRDADCSGGGCSITFAEEEIAAVPAAAGGNAGRSAWVGGSATTVSTNAPVLRWTTQVDSQGTFAYKVDVTKSGAPASIWSSGEVWQGNWPAHAPAFPGLCVYEGPSLEAGTTYKFEVTELQAADRIGHNASRSWIVGSGSFLTAVALPDAKAELIAQLRSNSNMTTLWNTSSTSIWSRVEPSGFLPTSVSGGYGGITSEFVRDGAGMIIGASPRTPKSTYQPGCFV